MTEYPGNLRAQEKHPGVLERSRNRNFGTGRKPQSFSVKRNFDLGPHEVVWVKKIPLPIQGISKPSCWNPGNWEIWAFCAEP